MRILVDMDGILADLHSLWFHLYQIHGGERLFLKDVDSWHIHAQDGKLLNQLLGYPSLFRDLNPLPGALEGLRELNKAHDVIIVSTPATSLSAADKLDWLAKHAPFIPRKNVFLGARKDLIQADAIIDDAPQHLTAPRINITIDYPYNRDVPVAFRAQGYQDTAEAWRQIIEYLTGGAPGATLTKTST